VGLSSSRHEFADVLAASGDLHAYHLMTNHEHLLLTRRIPDGVSPVIGDAGWDYVRTINSRHLRSGTMWEGRFNSSLVLQEVYCLDCYRYIELNRVRVRVVPHSEGLLRSGFRFNALDERALHLTPSRGLAAARAIQKLLDRLQ